MLIERGNKMRKIFIVFAIALLSVTIFSQRKQTDLEIERLKGKVKSVQASSIFFGSKEKPVETPKREYSDLEIYGSDGNIAEEHSARLGLKYVYEFVDGFLSLRQVVVDEKKAKNIMRGRLMGNAEDMEKPVKTIKPDERFLTRFDYEYDADGRRKLRRIFDSDGRMNSITFYAYNPAGSLEKEIYNSYGTKWTYFYSYDSDGNLKEKIMKRSNASDAVDMTERTEYSDYKFDAGGNWIERKYIYRSEYDDDAPRTSQGINYRDIKYDIAETPKKAIRKKAKE